MTNPYPAESTTVMPTPEPEKTSTKGFDIADVVPEKPRNHPLTYLALALSVIALIWLAAMAGGGDDYQKVRVGSEDCVSVPQDNGPAVLYCRK